MWLQVIEERDAPLVIPYHGSFEEGGTGGWYVNGAVTISNSSTQVYSGTKSLKVDWAGGLISIRRTVTGLTIGKKYRFSAAVYVGRVSGSSVGISVEGMAMGAVRSSWNNTWGRLGYIFTATATSHNLDLSVLSSTTGTDYVDDVRVDVDMTALSDENAEFENGTVGDWTGSSGAVVSNSSVRARRGTKSLNVVWPTVAANGAGASVAVPGAPLTIGKTYYAFADVWVPSGSPKVRLLFVNNFYPYYGVETSTNDTWQNLTTQITPTATEEILTVRPSQDATAGQQVWLDGFEVNTQPIRREDQSFENGTTGGWFPTSFFGAFDVPTALNTSTARATEGERSLVCQWSNNTGKVGSYFCVFVGDLTLGLTYTFEIDVWVNPGSPPVRMHTLATGYGEFSTTTGAWETIRMVWNCDATDTYVGIFAANTLSTHYVWIDNFRVVPTVSIESGNFECGTVGDWTVGGTVAPTIANSSVRSKGGTKSMLVTWGAGGSFPSVKLDVHTIVGFKYRAQFDVWIPSGSKQLIPCVNGISLGVKSSNWNTWQTIWYEWTAVAAYSSVEIWPENAPVGGEQAWIDNVKVSKVVEPLDLDAQNFEGGTTANWDVNTFWSQPGATLTNSTARAHAGTRSLLITWPTTSNGSWVVRQIYTVVGESYTVTAWVYVPSGSPNVRFSVPFEYSTVATTVKNSWTQITVNFVAKGTTSYIGLDIDPGTATAGQQCWVDDVAVTAGPKGKYRTHGSYRAHKTYRGGTATAGTPMPQPKIWLRSDDFVAADGTVITGWQNIYNNDLDAVESTNNTAQITYRAAITPSQVGALDFIGQPSGGSGKYLTTRNAGLTTAGEMWLVLSPDNVGGTQGGHATVTSYTALTAHWGYNGGVYEPFGGGARPQVIPDGTILTGQWYIYRVYHNGVNRVVYLDRVLKNTDAPGAANFSGIHRIGSGSNDAYTFEGKIASFLLFDRVLDTTEADRVWTELENRYITPLVAGATAKAAPQYWMDASKITGLADNALIATVDDQSGNGYTTTGVVQPTYKTAITPTGLPVIRFNTASYMSSTVPADAGKQTIFAVVKAANIGGLMSIRGSWGGDGGFQFRVNASGYLEALRQGQLNLGASTTKVTLNTFQVVAVTYNDLTDTASFYINGVAVGAPVIANTSVFTPGRTGSVSIGTSNSEKWNGDIAELVSWSRILTPVEITNISEELKAKWIGNAYAGVASMTAPSVLTSGATVVKVYAGVVAMTAPSTVTVAAVRTTPAVVAMTAPSTLVSAAVRTAVSSVSMTAPSTLTTAAVRATAALAAMTAPSTLTATVTATRPAAVSMTAPSTFVSAALPIRFAIQAMTAPSALVSAATTSSTSAATVTMTAPSTMAPTATAAGSATQSMSAPSTLVSGALPIRLAVVSMTAASVLSPVPVRLTNATQVMTAPSALVVAGVRTTAAVVSMTANSALTAAATSVGASGVQMFGPSTLTAGSSFAAFATVTMTAPSILTTAAVRITGSTVTLTAPSTMLVAGLRTALPTVSMAASSLLGIAGVRQTFATQAMTAPSTCSIASEGEVQGVVVMEAPAVLTTAGARETDAAMEMLAASVLAVQVFVVAKAIQAMETPSILSPLEVRTTAAIQAMFIASVLRVNAVKFSPTGSPFWFWDGDEETPMSAWYWTGTQLTPFTNFEITS